MTDAVVFGAGEWDDERSGSSDVFDLLNRPAWHSRAACRGSDPNLFFPSRGEEWKDAVAICNTCKVRAECLEAGMTAPVGVWGGMPEPDRRRLGRSNRAA